MFNCICSTNDRAPEEKKLFCSVRLTEISGQISSKAHVRSSHQRCSVRKGALRSFAKLTGKHLSQSLFLIKLQALLFIKKETMAQVFSCKFCEISKDTFLHNTSGRLLLICERQLFQKGSELYSAPWHLKYTKKNNYYLYQTNYPFIEILTMTFL